MLIQARTVASGRRAHFRNIGPRVLKFIGAFLANGGRGRNAALDAGYAPSSASVTSSQLLKDPRVLDLIAAEFRRRPGDYGAALAAKRLLRPSRPEWLRVRFKLALDKHTSPPRLVGTPEHPAVISDPAAEAMRDHLARHAGELGLTPVVPIRGANAKILGGLPSDIDQNHRLPHAVAGQKKDS